MLNLIRNKYNKNKVYDDISTLYDIVDIKDNYILIKDKNILKQVYVYKIEPVTILNINESTGNSIISAYTEFLRSVNYDFQIYIENTEININNYFDNIILDNKNINKTKLAKIYKNELEKSLNENNIFISYYYIVFSIEHKNNLEEIKKNIYILTKTGVVVEKLEGKENLKNFIYTKVNKVDNIC